MSQCTYRCVVIPDSRCGGIWNRSWCLNAPTGAWCSLTLHDLTGTRKHTSQCIYRCVVLPDLCLRGPTLIATQRLNAPTGAWCSLTKSFWQEGADSLLSQCTYRCVVLPDGRRRLRRREELYCLNAPTGAWCSLTGVEMNILMKPLSVSMHLQVRGAP